MMTLNFSQTNLNLLFGDVQTWAVLVVSSGDVLHRPGEGANEGHNQVDQRPADDDVVVSHNAEGSENGSQTHAGEARMDSTEDTDISALELLTERQLHESDGDTDSEEAYEVRNEEECATPGEAQVGETPEVSEADTVADHSEDEGPTGEPSSSLGTIVFVCEAAHEAVPAAHRFRT